MGLVVVEFVWLWHHSIAQPRIPPTRRKRHRDIFYACVVIAWCVSNFVAMATRMGRCKIWLTSFHSPTPKNPVRCKLLRDISYTSRVIAYFVPNFVAMATRVVRSKIWLTSFDSPTTKTPVRRKHLSDIFYVCRVIAVFPTFCCHGNRGWSWSNLSGIIQ